MEQMTDADRLAELRDFARELARDADDPQRLSQLVSVKQWIRDLERKERLKQWTTGQR